MKKKIFYKNKNFTTQQVVWKTIANYECIYVTLSKHVTEEEVQQVIDKSVELNFNSDQDKSIVIWDATNMERYDSKARELCQKLLKKHSDTADSVWVITESTMIYALAEIISFFSSRTIKVVKNESILHKKIGEYIKNK